VNKTLLPAPFADRHCISAVNVPPPIVNVANDR
jgi:hypothetical protein